MIPHPSLSSSETWMVGFRPLWLPVGQRGSWDPLAPSESSGASFCLGILEYKGTEGPPIYLALILPHFFLLPNSFVLQQRG